MAGPQVEDGVNHMSQVQFVERCRRDARERRAGHTVHHVLFGYGEVAATADVIEAVESEGWRLEHMSAWSDDRGTKHVSLMFRVAGR